ncbi:O-glucosyltransferase rumi homolog [Linum perenne]
MKCILNCQIGTLGINIGGGEKSHTDENSTTYSNYKYPLINCSSINNITSPSGPHHHPTQLSPTTCPHYFRWIQEDLRPWKSQGISREDVERAKPLAHFRLVIVNGKAYLERFNNAFQTRDIFTLWGILQLLRMYPGRVPDLELMFRCEDRPAIHKSDVSGTNSSLSLPVLFHYCGDEDSLGVVFPDWSFWGWAEINVKPWKSVASEIIEKSKKNKWEDRVPYAYWKGNPNVSYGRRDLLKCNFSKGHEDWGSRLYKQASQPSTLLSFCCWISHKNWVQEERNGYVHSKLKDQCTHRYKIYIEGVGWSVSEKYILACDSMALFVKPKFHDFFTRSLIPLRHYWPVRPESMCRDIKFAVEWGNRNPSKARAIGKAGSRFMKKNLKMEYVYDYMLHTLTQYAKLLRFKPRLPEGFEPGDELRSETMACSREGVVRQFMLESAVESPSHQLPCSMPSYDNVDESLHAISNRRREIEKKVVKLEEEYYGSS